MRRRDDMPESLGSIAITEVAIVVALAGIALGWPV